MKTIFKVFGLVEQSVVMGVWLSSDGVDTETKMITMRLHQGDFDSEFEAMKFVEQSSDDFEHGFEIVKTFKVI